MYVGCGSSFDICGDVMKIQRYKLSGIANEQNGPRNACLKYIDEEMQSGAIDVVITPHNETRRDKQNRLMWMWNGQIAKAMGFSANYVHGMCKLDIGLPYMLTDEALHKRAMFVSEVLDHVIERDIKIGVSFDMIRTRDLSVEQFAHYLTLVDTGMAENGVVLTSPDDLRAEALYRSTRDA